MKLGKRYKIEADALNLTVFKRRVTKKDKKVWWQPIGYFSRLQNALNFVADLEIADDGMRDLETITKKQDEIYKMIESAEARKR